MTCLRVEILRKENADLKSDLEYRTEKKKIYDQIQSHSKKRNYYYSYNNYCLLVIVVGIVYNNSYTGIIIIIFNSMAMS